MKKFISGALTGAILTSAIAFAASYTADPASFKVFVNGKEFNSDPPALVVEGRTYLPLRAIGDALSVPVEWNSELNRAEVGTKAPSVVKSEYSRSNPAPLNTMQTYTESSEYFDSENYSVNIRIIETVRGDEAWKKIYEANQFNETAPDGYEYILAKVAFSVLSTKGDFAVTPSKYQFKCFTSNNEEVEQPSIVEPKPNLSGNLYEGGNTEGWICVLAKKGDTNPKLAYGLDYNGAGGIWFALQ